MNSDWLRHVLSDLVFRNQTFEFAAGSLWGPIDWKFNYRFVFVHFLCSLRKAQVNFDKGICLDTILVNLNEALHTACLLVKLSDTSATYRKQWKTLFDRIELQCVVFCVIREDYEKATCLVQNYNLHHLLPFMKMDAQVSDIDKVADIQQRSTWEVFNRQLTRELQFAYEIPSISDPSSDQTEQQLKKQFLVNFLKVAGRLRENAEKHKDLLARTKPVSIENMKKVVMNIKEALIRMEVDKVQVDNLVFVVRSICLKRFERILQEACDSTFHTS